jgi:surfactin family lipopeptide synthetase A
MSISSINETDVVADQDKDLFPTSLAQQRLWFLHQLEPQSPAYHLTANVRLNLALDVEALQVSLNTLLERHEALRTGFVALDGRPWQLITPRLALPVPLVDLSALSERQQQAETLRLASQEIQQPFDLGKAPLMRTRLLKLAERDFLLLLTFHHIITDGWSINVFFRELATLYEAFTHGRPDPLPPLPLQYVDFAIWEQEYIQRNGLAEQLAYWKRQLAGAPTTLTLPTDRPRPTSPSSRGSRYVMTLPTELVDALKTLSLRQGTTLYMTLVAAFGCLLSRYSSQEDLVLGTVASGRTRAESESLIGFFVNTLVLRTDLTGDPTFSDLLGRVREVVLQAYAHQEVPFDYLIKELQPERLPGQNPLFQVLLSLDPPMSPPAQGWTPVPMIGRTETSKFDLSLALNDGPHGMACHFEYSTDLFDEASIARMAGHWQTLLEGIVADPTQHVTQLPLLTEKERHQFLVEWNGIHAEYPQDLCIHQLFEAQVEHTPDALAVSFEGQHLTYQELNSKANQLARYLQGLGVGPEVLVGLCVERSPLMIVGLLGILKAGGVYVPLDPEYPRERLTFLVQDTQMPVMLVQQHLISLLPQQQSQLVCLDRDWDEIAKQSKTNPNSGVAGENLAYVIYTSGSTGQPKGVLIPHRAVAAHCHSMTQVFELRAEDCVLQFSTFTFDASLEQILTTLLVGARLLLRGQDLWSPAQLLEQIKEDRLTVINLTPAYWHHVLQEWARTPQRLLGHHLRLAIVGGDRLPPEALQLWRQTPLCSARLLNAYGPTETTITAILYDTSGYIGGKTSSESVPIGRPLPNRKVYVLDRAGAPVPIGVSGELHIGGELLARGYLNRSELTAERFIADPFSHEPHARLYKTGDLARYLSDGTIEFLGRVDEQVKIRGYRIELGEIEAVLSQHHAVRQAVVVAREDKPGDKRLVAYVVLQQDRPSTISDLRDHLGKTLPGYMVPSAFVPLEMLPVTRSGKVDRRALPAPESARHIEEETFVAPTLPVHYQLIKIWEELLDLRPIGMRDNFFYLGGHSLLAARLVARIEEVFGKHIPLATLFAGPTIEQLANVLQEPGEADEHAALVTVQAGETKRPFFFLHGDYKGGAFFCFSLARGLGSDQPFYALEPYQFDGLHVPPPLEVMASAHIKLIRAVQPEGPYLLGGFCNGGLVAYEMARQLHAAGETIDLLVLINPTLFGRKGFVHNVIKRFSNLVGPGQQKQLTAFLWQRHMYRYVQHLYRYLRFPRYRRLEAQLEPEEADRNGGTILTLKAMHELWLSYGAGRSEAVNLTEPSSDTIRPALPSLRLAAVFPDPIFPTIEAMRHDWGGLFQWAASNYVPSFYPGKSTFFFSWGWHSQEPPPVSEHWRKAAEARDKEVEVHTIAGTHDTCKTDYLDDLTERLRRCLNEAQTSHQR